MNFQDLMSKIREIDERVTENTASEPQDPDNNATPDSPNDQVLIGEKSVEECGDMMPMMAMQHAQPAQQDTVTMNVSLNGSGAGGVRDLMDILHKIEQGGGEQDAGSDEILVGLEADEDVSDGGFGAATTTPDTHVEPIASVLKKGPDMHGNMGDHRQRQTGLPRAQMESLVSNLSSLYQEIKERQ
jgi:hypothetical protein